MRISSPRSLCLVVLALTVAATAKADPPAKSHNKVAGTPDLVQTLKEAKFEGGGSNFCGPVATSNSLVWLAGHGFPNLLGDEKADAKKAQIEMVRLLASDDLMATSVYKGTGPNRLMRGIEHYVKNHGYEVEEMKYQGWRRVSRRYHDGPRVPQAEWIKQGAEHERSAVLWNIGWYKKADDGNYVRLGGHWVTLVGVETDKKSGTATYLLHDPAPRAGKNISQEHVTLRTFDEAKLTVDSKGRQPVKGLAKLEGDFHQKPKADLTILDGVVVAKLAAPKNTSAESE